ncbi:MAG: hypothetical protein U0T82_08380 [Bacteroidales bacterium]
MLTSLRFSLFLIILSLLFTCCKKEETLPVDPKYPHTYYTLDPDSLLKKQIVFHAKYPSIFTGIDEFGFFGYDTFPEIWPTRGPSLLQEEAADFASRFLIDNALSSGITNQNFSFNSIELKPDNNGNNHWHFDMPNQFKDTIEVYGSGISLKVMNGEIYMCNGHWYPDIYIPATFNFTKEKTLEKLTNYSLKYYTQGGVKNHRLTDEELKKARTRPMIIPLESESTIEMHVAWFIDTGLYLITVDVMTGRVLSEGIDALID